MTSLRAPLAEFIGTFGFFFIGIAAILGTTSAIGTGAGLIGIALAHGLALSVAVHTFGGVSGAHFNPAVTFGMLATGRIKAGAAVAYVIAQLAAGVAAAAFCKAVFPAAAVAQANLGIPLPAPGVSTGTILALEFVMTFLLMTAIYGTAVDERGRAVKIGGFGIGLAVTGDILAGGPITGASMNPARSFGPALVQGDWAFHGLYWAAPIAGAVVAALVYEHVILDKR